MLSLPAQQTYFSVIIKNFILELTRMATSSLQ